MDTSLTSSDPGQILLAVPVMISVAKGSGSLGSHTAFHGGVPTISLNLEQIPSLILNSQDLDTFEDSRPTILTNVPHIGFV